MSLVHVVDVRYLFTPEQRATVCYVGRAFAGWSEHKLANPFKKNKDTQESDIITAYRGWLTARDSLNADLDSLWEECKHGQLPLGCWCGEWKPDDPPIPCHACVLAQLLNSRQKTG